MSLPTDSGRARLSVAAHLRRAVWELRTEGTGPGREAAAIGLGVFIGSSPLYGFHLLLCWAAGWCLGLNRLKMYLAANISNPIMAPLLILTELEAGAWFRRGQFHSLTLGAVRDIDPWSFGADIVIGSLIVGTLLGGVTAAATYVTARSGHDDDMWFVTLVRRAADRYVHGSIVAWEFARGKLRGDPLYRTVLAACSLPSGGTLVDVGCGQGLMIALLVESAAAWRAGSWRPSMPPPVFDRLVGIETRARVARIARLALGDAATIIEGDARTQVPDGARVVLFFDVLHMMPASDQEQLLEAAAQRLEPEGVMLVREPDRGAGWRFSAVRAGNRAKALLTGNWRQTFHFRTAREWSALFERLGFRVEPLGTSDGTPFANVLFVLTRRSNEPA
jgi:uncharacterized protein (DUF2062 family)/trans-aconitate methyltransferase